MKVLHQQLYPLEWPGCQQKSLLSRRVRSTRKAPASLPTCKQRTSKATFAFERSSETGFRSKKHQADQRRKNSAIASSIAMNSSSTFSPSRSCFSSGGSSPRMNFVRNNQATDISETIHRLLLSEAQHPSECERQNRSVNYTFRTKKLSASGKQRSHIFTRPQSTWESAGQTDGSAGTPIDESNNNALTISPIQQDQFDSTNTWNSPEEMEGSRLNHLAGLRHEAYQDLALSTQTYNDSIVNRMRYLETLSREDQRAILHRDSGIWMSDDEFQVKEAPVDVDVDVDDLTTLMEKDAVGVKDYGELLEFERGVIGHNVDEANWVGDLW